MDNDGKYQYSNEVEVNFEVPLEFNVSQNYPNPFNPNTTISYTLPEASQVKLTVYNSLGEELSTLVNSFNEAGAHTVNFNAARLASGMYFYKIEANGFSQVKKMILMK